MTIKADCHFPEDLYVRLVHVRDEERTIGGLKAEIYRRIESKDNEVVHMKRAGLIWLHKLDLGYFVERLKDESSWDTHD